MLVVLATALFGTIGTARVLGPEASSWSVGSWRMLAAALVLVAVAAHRDGLGPLRSLVRTRAAWVAGAGQAAFQLTFLTAVERTGVALTTLVAIGSAPLITGLVTRSVSRRWAVATGLGIVGLVLLVGGSKDGVSGPAVLLPLAAGAAYSGYTVASGRLNERASSASVTAAGFVLAAVILSPSLLFADHRWLLGIDGVAMLAYLSLVATAAAYLLFVKGLRTVPAATAQTLGLTEPVVATLLGVLVLGETLDLTGIAGAVLVLLALGVLATQRRAPVVLG